MADSNLSTILISAAIGGLSGSFFPALRDAVIYVFLDAPKEIAKAEADIELARENSKSESDLSEQLHEKFNELFSVSVRASDVFKLVADSKDPIDKNIFAESAELLAKVKAARAGISAFQGDLLKSPYAKALVDKQLDLADRTVELLHAIYDHVIDKPGLLATRDGCLPFRSNLNSAWVESLGAVAGTLILFKRDEDQSVTQRNFSISELSRSLTAAKSKKHLSLCFLAAAVVVVILAIGLWSSLHK